MKDTLMILGSFISVVVVIAAIGFVAMWRERHGK